MSGLGTVITIRSIRDNREWDNHEGGEERNMYIHIHNKRNVVVHNQRWHDIRLT